MSCRRITPRDDDVLVRICAIAVTRADCATREADTALAHSGCSGSWSAAMPSEGSILELLRAYGLERVLPCGNLRIFVER